MEDQLEQRLEHEIEEIMKRVDDVMIKIKTASPLDTREKTEDTSTS